MTTDLDLARISTAAVLFYAFILLSLNAGSLAGQLAHYAGIAI